MSSHDKAIASGLSQKELEAIGRGATIDTIDSILAQYPDRCDRGDILDGFQRNEYHHGLYFEREQKRFREQMKAIREKEDRKWFWIIGLTSPLWLTASLYGFYQLADGIKRYPLQICAVCAILIAVKVLTNKSTN